MKPNSPLKKLSVIALLTFGGLGASTVLEHADAHASNVPTTEMPINAGHLHNLGLTNGEIRANTPSQTNNVTTNQSNITNANQLHTVGVRNNNGNNIVRPIVMDNDINWAKANEINQTQPKFTPIHYSKPSQPTKPTNPVTPKQPVTPAKPKQNTNNHKVTPVAPAHNNTNKPAPAKPSNKEPSANVYTGKVHYIAKQPNGTYKQGSDTIGHLNATDKTPDSVEIMDNNPKAISQNLYQMYENTFKLINKYRASKGIKPVAINYNLNHLATLRAQQIRTNFSHYNKQGQSLENLEAPKFHIVKTPTDASYHMSENIANAYLSPDLTMPTDPVQYQSESGNQISYLDNDSMFNYDSHEPNWSHRVNILNPYSTEVGIGCAYDMQTGDYTLVEDFYQPNTINAKQASEYVKNALAGIELHPSANNSALIEQVAHYSKIVALDNGQSKQQANHVWHFAYNKARELSNHNLTY